MLVGIHQLHYLPWLRYVEKMHTCDAFIVLDNVQFNKNGWQNRNRIKTASGPALLTVPVHARVGDELDRVTVCNRLAWRRKHWGSIDQNYRRAPYYDDYSAFLRRTFDRDWETLNDLNRYMQAFYVDALGIDTAMYYASELEVPGQATERLVNLVKAVGGDEYYSGAYALDAYLDAKRFEDAGIRLRLQNWNSPEYPQLHGDYIGDLAIIDLLMNCGPRSLAVLELGRQ